MLTSIATLGIAATSMLLPGVSAQDTTGIFVAGYDGFVRTVNLQNQDGAFSLNEVNKTDGCKGNPSWLSLDHGNQRLWCVDEGWATINGTLNTFDVEDGGNLVAYQSRNISAGPVQTKFFAKGSKLAVAQFGGAAGSNIRGGITVHSIDADGALQGDATNITFDALEQPGPKPGQDVPRGHGVTLDPTGNHLVVTDYGADKIRVFDVANDTVTKGIEMEADPGSAPRHAVFHSSGCLRNWDNSAPLFLFVLAENANTITTYNVTYDTASGSMELSTPVKSIDTFGGNATQEMLDNAKASEIQISPDKNFVIVSNRMDNFTETGDSLSTYKIETDGSLTFVQRAAVGGKSPRHFAVNRAGDKVLVSLTASSSITVLSRDVDSGMIGEPLATLAINTTVEGTTENAGIPAAVWYE